MQFGRSNIQQIFFLFSTVYYAKIGGFLCYIAPFLIVLFNEKMLDLILPVFNSAVLLKGLDLIDIYGMKGKFLCDFHMK